MKILAKKLNMSQIWKEDKVIPVTVLLLVDQPKEFPTEIKENQIVKISGLSKGRGFQGVVKRHGFSGGPKSHGQKDRLRAPGSIGATAPQRVIKGKKMAGHMGQKRITEKKKIVSFDLKENLLMIKGAVPGMKGTKVQIEL